MFVLSQLLMVKMVQKSCWQQTVRNRAKIAFDMCSKFSKTDTKGKYLTAYRADILFKATNSKLKVLAADSKLDGFNASSPLLDEFHAAKTSKVRDVIKSSMGMRENPHLCTITTAGFDKTYLVTN